MAGCWRLRRAIHRAGLRAKETLDAGGHWVIPGFISPIAIVAERVRGSGLGPDAVGWIDALYKPAVKSSPEDMYWFTLDGALDHLQHGITAAYNFNFEARNRARNRRPRTSMTRTGFARRWTPASALCTASQWARPPTGVQPSYGAEQARVPLKAFLDWTATATQVGNFLP